jgi:nucleotide-binding universal stress UspA family protein
MDQILIATDFSPAAQSAVDYGVQLAAALGATATVIAAYQEIPVPVADTMSMTFIDTAAARDIVEQGLGRLQDRYEHENIPPIRTLAVKGSALASILSMAVELNAGMIITGMKDEIVCGPRPPKWRK